MKVQVQRGRKVSHNYQCEEATITVYGDVRTHRDGNPDSEPYYDEQLMRADIARLWDVAESELELKVAEIKARLGREVSTPAVPSAPSPPPTNGYAPPPSAPPPFQPPPPANGYGPPPAGGTGQLREPKEGRHVYPWCKKLEELHHRADVVTTANRIAKANGLPYKFTDFSPEQAVWLAGAVKAELRL